VDKYCNVSLFTIRLNFLILHLSVNLPGTSSYLPPESNLHRFYTPRTYIKHYDRLLSTSTLMGDEEIDRLLDGLRIVHDRRDIRVGDSFHRLVHINLLHSTFTETGDFFSNEPPSCR
jgi:hypothetical protein